MSDKKPVILPHYEIDKICNTWGAQYKYTQVFRVIAEHYQPVTHYISNKATCNNVPDQVKHINKRLKKRGLEVICTPQLGKGHQASHQWFLVEVDK